MIAFTYKQKYLTDNIDMKVYDTLMDMEILAKLIKDLRREVHEVKQLV